MDILRNFYVYNFNAIVLSKTSIGSFVGLKKIVCFFIINVKVYKKNLLLFYIILNILFCERGILKKKSIDQLQIIKVVVKNKKSIFLHKFVQFYLPILGTLENSIKLGTFCVGRRGYNLFKKIVYRINYFAFPVIPELDLIYGEYEAIYNVVSTYRLQLDFVTKTRMCQKGDFFQVRMYR